MGSLMTFQFGADFAEKMENGETTKRPIDTMEEDPELEDLQPKVPQRLIQKKITKAILEEQDGQVDFTVVRNDSSDRSMILLSGLRTIFQKQLPNMPKEYIARLVYDRYWSF
jgi:hypothetical protein